MDLQQPHSAKTVQIPQDPEKESGTPSKKSEEPTKQCCAVELSVMLTVCHIYDIPFRAWGTENLKHAKHNHKTERCHCFHFSCLPFE